MPLLVTQKLSLSRPTAPRLSYPDFHIERGGQLLLTGPSGCGKTTLLSILAGLLPPGAGTVTFDGEDIYKAGQRARDKMRGQKIGFVFQNLHLVPSLTLEQNIALAASMAGAPLDKKRMEDVLSFLGLASLRTRKPHLLSHGERQRAAIARAILNKPALIIADEPTSALDDDNAHAIATLLKRCAAESGAALLIATHDHRLMAHVPTVLSLEQNIKAMAA